MLTTEQINNFFAATLQLLLKTRLTMSTNNPNEFENKTVNSDGPRLSNSDILMCVVVALIVVFLLIAGGYYWYTNPDWINNLITNP